MIIAVFLASTFVAAKDKSLNDYPLRLEVQTQDFTGKGTRITTGAISSDAACHFVVADERMIYVVENRNVFNCHTWTPGTILSAREAKIWGQPYVEFVWADQGGKLKTQKYTLLYKRLR